MARTNQTKLAVLGALSVEPMSGYALREAIRDVLGQFWSESFGQIYPTLKELESDGHVAPIAGRRPGSSVFTITASGLELLRELLAAPFEPVPPRNGLLLRLFFGRQLGVDGCRTLLLTARADAERQLAGFAGIRAETVTEPQYAADHPYWLITVAAGEHTSRAYLAWIDESLATLDAITPNPIPLSPIPLNASPPSGDPS